MREITLPITPNGPICDILVAVSGPRMAALRQKRKEVPLAVPARALIDTGSTSTSVDPTIVSKLGLIATGVTWVITSTTGTKAEQAAQYDVSLLLFVEDAPYYLTQAIPVIGMRHVGAVDVLLGRDVLSQCTFIYEGKQGQCRIIV